MESRLFLRGSPKRYHLASKKRRFFSSDYFSGSQLHWLICCGCKCSTGFQSRFGRARPIRARRLWLISFLGSGPFSAWALRSSLWGFLLVAWAPLTFSITRARSTVATCLKLVLPQSWPLWFFHWIDGWITTIQIVERLPKKDDYRSPIEIAAREALYYAWKLGSAGMLPSILTGNELIASGKNSIGFVKENFKHIAALRAGYSALCWIVGIGAYVGAIGLLLLVDILPDGNEVYSHIYDFYLWMAVPIVIALSVVMLLLRPIYVLAMCDLYSDYLESKEVSPRLPDDVSKGRSALVVLG